MKRYTFLIIILLVSLTSCEKIQMENDLQGTWKLWKVRGGYSGEGFNANFSHLIIPTNKHFEIQQNETLLEDGTYNIYKVDKVWAGSNWRIEFNRNIVLEPGATFLSEGAFCFDSSDTLSFAEVAYDGFTWVFIKE